MRHEFLNAPIWLIGVIVTALMILAAEIGYHIGRRNTACDSGVGAVKASILALVGLLLAFSYSIAAGHYDRRKQVVVEEAKSLKTCWLRTDLVAEPARSRARELLRSLVEARLMSHDRAADPKAEQRFLAHQLELWALAYGQLHQSSEPDKHVLLVQSVNDVIDRGGERAAAAEHRVPMPVMYLLIASILVSGFLIGLSSGQDQRRIPLLWAIVIILMVGVLTIIFDLDNPGRGLIPDWTKPLDDVKAIIGGVGR
ncbi:MAG: hypothetical protein WBD40_24030 [Tepidisphaeraceae bacterium]